MMIKPIQSNLLVLQKNEKDLKNFQTKDLFWKSETIEKERMKRSLGGAKKSPEMAEIQTWLENASSAKT